MYSTGKLTIEYYINSFKKKDNKLISLDIDCISYDKENNLPSTLNSFTSSKENFIKMYEQQKYSGDYESVSVYIGDKEVFVHYIFGVKCLSVDRYEFVGDNLDVVEYA